MPARSPFTRVTPALWIATSVPVPIAMPTSAAAKAGRVIDAVAGHGDHVPFGAQLLDDPVLVVRQHIGHHIVDAELAGDRLGRAPVVAGEHDDAHARPRAACRSASCVVGLIGSAMAMTPPGLPSTRQKQRRGPLPAQRVGLRLRDPRARSRDRPSARRCRAPPGGRRPCPITPLPVTDANVVRLRDGKIRAPCGRDDGGGERMLARPLKARRERQDSCFRQAFAPARSRPRAACLRSACRSCRRPAYRPSPSAPAPRRI